MTSGRWRASSRSRDRRHCCSAGGSSPKAAPRVVSWRPPTGMPPPLARPPSPRHTLPLPDASLSPLGTPAPRGPPSRTPPWPPLPHRGIHIKPRPTAPTPVSHIPPPGSHLTVHPQGNLRTLQGS
ncbi:protein of unknown function [Streptomyces murinus]